MARVETDSLVLYDCMLLGMLLGGMEKGWTVRTSIGRSQDRNETRRQGNRQRKRKEAGRQGKTPYERPCTRRLDPCTMYYHVAVILHCEPAGNVEKRTKRDMCAGGRVNLFGRAMRRNSRSAPSEEAHRTRAPAPAHGRPRDTHAARHQPPGILSLPYASLNTLFVKKEKGKKAVRSPTEQIDSQAHA